MRLSSLFQPSLIGGLLACTVLVSAHADEVRVLSAGAIEPGLRAAAAAFDLQTGHVTTLTFNTAPALRRRMGVGLDVGRVGMGVTVRDGAPVPDISSPAALQLAVLAADSLVFNRASTGLYFEELLKKMDM